MKKLIFCFAPVILAATLFSCASSPEFTTETIVRGTGTALGTVTASATVTENKKTGEATGDTLKYGYIVNENEKKDSQAKRLAANALTGATEKAYANALYEIIKLAKAMGGNALNEVVSSNKRSYNIYAETETVTVTITAEVIVLK